MSELKLPLKVDNKWGSLCIRDAEGRRRISIDSISWQFVILDQGDGEFLTALIVRAVNCHRKALDTLRDYRKMSGIYDEKRDALDILISEMEADSE